MSPTGTQEVCDGIGVVWPDAATALPDIEIMKRGQLQSYRARMVRRKGREG